MKTQINTQRPVFILLSIAMIMLLATALVSCSFDESENNYRGGDLLDEEKMSEIRNEVLGGSNGDSDNSIDNDATLKPEGTQKDTEGTERNETERSDFEVDTATIVYWTDSGSVWHISRDCYHIKNKEVASGTVSEAEAAGHKSSCKTCNKKDS